MLPQISGWDVCRELRKDSNVPVIMVSTIDQKTFTFYQKFQSTSKDKGVPEPGAYLEKPLETEELIRLVKAFTAADECPLSGDDE